MNGPLHRADLIAPLRHADRWDVIVIGGGATGLGTALEAASRGYRTLLLEQCDFAKGTSSRSTKLVHGGVRYLAQGNVKLVRESLRERGLLRGNAPHLVRDLTFIVPTYSWRTSLFYGLGLQAYDRLAGSLSFGASRWLSRRETLDRLPTLKAEGLTGGVLYHDGQFDDARLAIALLRTLLDHGGIALNYLPVTGLLKDGDRIAGVLAQDAETGERFELRSRAVINATGVFADAIRQMDHPNQAPLLSPSQGIHLVIDRQFYPGDSALLIPRTADGRVLFAVPWHDRVVIGTTDTPVAQPLLEPRAQPQEIDFILRTVAAYLVQVPDPADVLSVFAGLRPLVKRTAASTAALSRDHRVGVSESGLITITGGKWTTYRQMGEDAVDRAIAITSLPVAASRTRHLPLHGWALPSQIEAPGPLASYGSDAPFLRALPGADLPLHPLLPYSEAEVRWAARYELARTVEDVLARRTRALLLNARASLACAPRVAALLAEELGQTGHWQQQQLERYRSIAQGYWLSNRPLA